MLSIVKNRVGETLGYDILNLDDGQEYRNVKIKSLLGHIITNGQIVGKETPYIRGNKKLQVRTESSKVILYHGSNKVVTKPIYMGGYELNDYGKGFYTTTIREKAEEWALIKSGESIINTYKLDANGLKICDLDNFGPLAWIAEVIANRGIGELQKDRNYVARMRKFITRYKINTNGYDIIYGYRADDSYFGIVSAFLRNVITVDEVVEYFYKGKLGKQVFVKSRPAFGRMKNRV